MPELKIEITAELGRAKENLALLKQELNDLNQSLKRNDAAIAGLNKQLAGLDKNTKEGKNAAAGLKAELQKLAGVNTTLVKGISDVKGQIAAESESLKKLGKELKNADTSSSGFSKGISKAYSGLRNLAYLIPGIGIGGLIALITGPLVDAFEELFKSSTKAKDALKSTFEESAAAQGGNIARLQALVSIAQDVTKSDAARKEALGALNKEYDAFNGKLTLSNINTKAATDLIQKQTDAIVRQAQIKGVEDLITEETKKQSEIRQKDLKDQLGIFAKIRNAALTVLSPTIGQADALVQGLKARDEQLEESKKNIFEYSETLKKLLTKEAEAGTLFKEAIPKAIKASKPEVEKALKHVFGKTIHIQTAADILLDIQQAQREADAKLGKHPMKAKAEIQFEINESNLETEAQRAAKAFAKALDDANEQASRGLKDTFNSAIASIGQSIADSFTGAASFGEAVFGNLFKVLGAGLKQLGEAMVALGTAKVALEKFQFAPGIGTIIAGIAAIAIGALLERAIPGFADGVTNFAGGLALVGERGPELVRLPKGSDVIPNNQLGGISGNTNVFIPDVRIRGNDLVLVFNRASATIGRNG